MQMKSIVSALALSTAMLLSGAASAQTPTMFNGTELSEADLPKVQERCLQLVTASTTESLTADEDTAETSDNATESNAGESDATLENVENVNEVADATSTIDLDTVTLEQCTAAGLGGAM